MQPLQYDLRSPAAKDNGITHAATARSNLDAAITRRSAETELQNTIELRANTVETPFTMRNRSARRTAKVDHRRSGTHFVWKNIGFRASAISQKCISCETSFKTPSATHSPAPLAISFTFRERSYQEGSISIIGGTGII